MFLWLVFLLRNQKALGSHPGTVLLIFSWYSSVPADWNSALNYATSYEFHYSLIDTTYFPLLDATFKRTLNYE